MLTVRQSNALYSLIIAVNEAVKADLFANIKHDEAALAQLKHDLSKAQTEDRGMLYSVTYHLKADGNVREDSALIQASSVEHVVSKFTEGWSGKIVSIMNVDTKKYEDF